MDARERGEVLAGARDGMVMTQEALAAAAGVSVPTVKRAEAGKPIQAETLRALCAVLDLDCRDLAGDAPVAAMASRTPDEVRARRTPADVAMAVAGRVAAVRSLAWATLRRVGVFTAFLTCLPLVFEACAWLAPLANTPVFFRYMQIHAIKSTLFLFLWITVRDLWRDRSAWRTRSWALGLAAACVFMGADVGMALGPMSWFGRDMMAMATDMDRDLKDWRYYRRIVDRMAADDASYDRSVDDFNLFRQVVATGGVTDASWGTPGELKAVQEARARCREEWKRAAVYDKARCDVNSVHVTRFSRLAETVQAVTGGPFNDRSVQEEVARYFADKRFDEARAKLASTPATDAGGAPTVTVGAVPARAP